MDLPPLFCVYVRPNKRTTALLGFDPDRDAYILEIAATPTDGQANAEIVRYFKKNLGQSVEIVSGHTSRKKRIRVLGRTTHAD